MKKILLLVTSFAFLLINCNQAQNGGSAGGGSLNSDDFWNKLQATANAQIVDVRTPAEFQKNHLKGAMNLNINGPEFRNQVAALDKSKPVFVYCLSGGRSASAANYMRSEGFTEIYEMAGGMTKWLAANKPYEQGAGTSATAGMTLEAYNQQLQKAKVVMVDFNAPWCAPCRKMAPDLEALAKQYGPNGFELVQIDVDANPGIARALKVEALPTLMLYKNGQVVWNGMGYQTKDALEAQIKAQMN